MKERLFAIVVAGTLMVPQISSAFGSESAIRQEVSRFPHQTSSQVLPKPPIPYLDTMPWINSELGTAGPKIDTLLTPNVDEHPSWLPPLSISGRSASG